MSAPLYDAGQRVRALGNLLNDGSFPDAEEEAVLVDAGAIGEIIKVGALVENNAIVYLVEFNARAIGCFENEIAPL
jgi:nitrogen fixation protein NifZ